MCHLLLYWMKLTNREKHIHPQYKQNLYHHHPYYCLFLLLRLSWWLHLLISLGSTCLQKPPALLEYFKNPDSTSMGISWLAQFSLWLLGCKANWNTELFLESLLRKTYLRHHQEYMNFWKTFWGYNLNQSSRFPRKFWNSLQIFQT